jgi:hypothetical protein
MSKIPTVDTRLDILEMLPRQSVGMEIGVLTGDFSLKILEIVNPTKLYLVDSWREFSKDTPGLDNTSSADQATHDKRFICTVNRMWQYINYGRVVVLRCESQQCQELFPNNVLDWIYIDGNHGVDACFNDLLFARSTVRDSGHIILDDFVENRYAWEPCRYGVVKAVKKFLKYDPSYYISTISEARNPNVVLQKR